MKNHYRHRQEPLKTIEKPLPPTPKLPTYVGKCYHSIYTVSKTANRVTRRTAVSAEATKVTRGPADGPEIPTKHPPHPTAPSRPTSDNVSRPDPGTGTLGPGPRAGGQGPGPGAQDPGPGDRATVAPWRRYWHRAVATVAPCRGHRGTVPRPPWHHAMATVAPWCRHRGTVAWPPCRRGVATVGPWRGQRGTVVSPPWQCVVATAAPCGAHRGTVPCLYEPLMVSFRMMWVTRVGGVSAAPLCLRVLGVQESSYTIFLTRSRR